MKYATVWLHVDNKQPNGCMSTGAEREAAALRAANGTLRQLLGLPGSWRGWLDGFLIVGQNVLAAAADKRSEATYNDADAVLHEAVKIQEHLVAQDKVLSALIDKAQGMPG